jgi:hypothetical protein
MLTLKPNQVCPHATTCPYNNKSINPNAYCNGADSTRDVEFSCDLINSDQTFVEGKFRSGFDETGKMKIILE